jgi:archaellum component FlaG (FlaF/FlaG flagellin family)
VVDWIVVIATVVIVAAVVTVLVRQGTPGRLSQHMGDRGPQITDRPAGPDAETMAPPGEAEERARRAQRSEGGPRATGDED